MCSLRLHNIRLNSSLPLLKFATGSVISLSKSTRTVLMWTDIRNPGVVSLTRALALIKTVGL